MNSMLRQAIVFVLGLVGVTLLIHYITHPIEMVIGTDWRLVGGQAGIVISYMVHKG